MFSERCGELQQQTDALRRDLEAAHVNNAHLLRVRSILELSEKRLAEAVAQVSWRSWGLGFVFGAVFPSRCWRCLTLVAEPCAAEELRRAC